MRIAFLAVAALALSGGCNTELDQYNRIELGKPLAAGGVFGVTTRPAQGQKVNARLLVADWALPAISDTRFVGALVDTDGKVVAKLYSDVALEHWLVAQVGARDWRFELEIPAEYFKETPSDWRDMSPSWDDAIEMEMEARGLAEGLPDGQRRLKVASSRSHDEYRYVIDMPVNPKRINDDLLKRLKEGMPLTIDIRKDIDLSGLTAKTFCGLQAQYKLIRKGDQILLRAELVRPRDARHLVGYIGNVLNMFEEAARSQQPKEPVVNLAASYPMGMFVGGRTTWVNSLTNHHEDFRGLTVSGFERTIDFGDGGKARIRNLGGRRVQLEFKFCRIIDPFFVIPMIECCGRSERVVESRSVPATTPASQP